MKTVLLVDGDVVAYGASDRSWKEFATKNGGLLKTYLDESGRVLPVKIPEEEFSGYMQKVLSEYSRRIRVLREACFADEVIIGIKAHDNFRGKMYPEYKAKRNTNPKYFNQIVPALVKQLISLEFAVEAIGRETDDLLGIWRTQALENGDKPVISSIDKDLEMFHGTHLKLTTSAEYAKTQQLCYLKEVSEKEAIKNYYRQLLMGDGVDNIPGVPGLGKVTAANILEATNSEEELQEYVVGAYIAAYNDSWFDMLMSNGKMLHIQRHPNDYFTCRHWNVVKELL